ncbi:hypothetical protein NQ813_001684 [Campylobacter jejuni]|nr:hypothetical protein [Campylobacter jejuni]EJI3431531.1 hypothetical protein [Campylobacter jejuni]EJO0945374.1 hypothetical protein [Campylobacter jejuni]HDZ4989795.1 hypothetical protein [Campylobacter jejuni]HEG2724801.1 hypothetical protein [Campylobacter jejuni]
MKLKDFDFRIYDNHNKKYIDNISYSIKKYQNENKVFLPFSIDLSEYGDNETFKDEIQMPSDRVEIELFTGLYDKNGKKIYEGDIVSYITFQGTTLFYFVTINKDINIFEIFRIANLEKFELYNRTENDRFSLYLFSKINDMKDIEVIGNIHNKTNLLKYKK